MSQADRSDFVFATSPPARSLLRQAISQHYLADETQLVNRLVALAELPPPRAAEAMAHAGDWVARVRKLRGEQSPLDAFMQQYDLSSEEGVLLMCLAEALLRIPDDA
ncbi:MAG TPA: hypothetical protein VM074_09710, partial [Solimonas sp.]|nr:hypothetical protein [Solimonas sp.]